MDELGYVAITFRPIPAFLRCEVNGDGIVDPSDAVALLRYLFLSGSITACLPGADCNGRDGMDMNDTIYALEYYFLDGPRPSDPFPACGETEGVGFEECANRPVVCDA